MQASGAGGPGREERQAAAAAAALTIPSSARLRPLASRLLRGMFGGDVFVQRGDERRLGEQPCTSSCSPARTTSRLRSAASWCAPFRAAKGEGVARGRRARRACRPKACESVAQLQQAADMVKVNFMAALMTADCRMVHFVVALPPGVQPGAPLGVPPALRSACWAGAEVACTSPSAMLHAHASACLQAPQVCRGGPKGAFGVLQLVTPSPSSPRLLPPS